MNPLKLGIVGCGVIGTHHMNAVAGNADVEFFAAADLNEEALGRSAEQFGIPHTYSSAAELLDNSEVEAVVLALITSVRAPIALEALSKGKHVLIEKPPAMNVGELRRMKAIQGDRVIGCCSARFSFMDSAQRAREIIESGSIGDIRIIRCKGIQQVDPVAEGANPPPWRVSHTLNGGGYMVNWGVYDLDYLMSVTGWKLVPKTVLAQVWPIADHLAVGRVHPDSDGENHVVSMIRCEQGVVIVHERGEAVVMGSETLWQITGDKGSLQLRMVPYGGGTALHLETFDPDQGLVSTTVLDKHGEDRTMNGPVNDFARAIREGTSPATDIDRAITLQSMLDAIYESARTGAAVVVV